MQISGIKNIYAMINKYYNRFFVILFFSIFAIPQYSSAQNRDTTFNANMNNDSIPDRVKISYVEDTSRRDAFGCYEININDIKLIDSTNANPYFTVEVRDIDTTDVFQELFVKNGFDEFPDYNIYRFDGKNIFNLGNISGLEDFIIKGDGRIGAREWMGFWYYDYEYVLNPETMKIDAIKKDLYDIKMFPEEKEYDFIVDTTFSVFTDREDNSPVKFETVSGEKIKILKAYIKISCPEENNFLCVWYLIENSKGEQGWLMLNDFMDKVSGIPWAG